jgi:uncharacterized membrane protein SirB2
MKSRLQTFERSMIKIFHLTLVLISIFSFIGRIILSETHSKILKQKSFKIVPHILDTFLLISGIALIFQGQWLSVEYSWIIAKIFALVGYIGLGVMAMRTHGTTRWLAFISAIACFIYIGMVAVTKQPLFFL